MSVDTSTAIDIDRSVGDFSYPEKHEFDAGIGLTEKTVDYISEVKGEAEWIREFRQRALKVFREKPMPTHWATKDQMPSISLATVYNCLETMTQCGLVKQVNMDREPSRYCANLTEHAHFYCQACGEVSDIDVNAFDRLSEAFEVPSGTEVARYEVTIRGTCATCKSADVAT